MLNYCLLIWISYIVASHQNYDKKYVSIPETENCILSCNGTFICIKHKHCEQLNYHYDLRDNQHSAISELLVFGHNGLRNRLALTLDGCDMLRVTWDDDLAELSNRHHRNCERNIVCNSRYNKSGLEKNMERKLHQKIFIGNASHLVQNSYFHKNIYATNFIETAVGNWYMEHQLVEFPKATKYAGATYYKLIGDNNFTHIINPQTHRIGCSYARFYNGLSLICYYFPYIRDGTVFLRLKPEEYQCPYHFPILDPVFKTLCGYAVYS